MYEDEDLQEIHEDIIELDTDISVLRRDLNNISASVEGSGENVTLNQTAEARFKKAPLPMGNSEQVQYSGKNLAKVSGSASINLLGSISVSKDNNDIIINGTATGDVALQKAFVLDGDTRGNYAAYITPSNTISLTAGTYVLTIDNITGSYSGVSGFWIRLVKKTESQPYTGIASLVLPSTSISFNIEEDGEYFISPNFSYTSETSVTFNNYKFNIMLASGSDTSYEPYVRGTASPNPDYPQEITNVTGDVEVVVQNKNLAKINSTIKTARGTDLSQYNVSYTVDEDGTITLNGTANNGNVFVLGDLDLKPDTYMFEYIYVSGSVSSYVPTTIRDGSNNALKELSGNTVNDNKSLVNSVDGKSLTIYVSNGKAFTNFKFKIQIEKSSIVTDYVEHKEQTFIFPLGNEKLMLGDYLADDGIHHVRGQVVLNGSENINWNINNLTTHYNFYAQVAKNCKAKQLILCDHSSSNSFSDTLNNCYISASKSFNFNFSIDGVTTSNTFNNWLSTHNITVEYPLNEEVIVPYTSAQQEVYNQINTFYETTNIFSTDEVSPNFTFTYNKVYASPSPDDESPIQTVSGDVEVKVQNKNLFSSIWEQGAIDNGSGNNVITDRIIRTKDYIEVKQNTKYSISRSVSTDYFNVRGYDKNKNYIGSGGVATITIVGNNDSNPMLTGRKFCVIETKENVCYLRFNDASNDLSTEYMMVEGQYIEETMPSYVSHREQVLPLALKSKNLFDKARIVSTNQGNWEVVQITDGVRIIHKNSYYTGTPSVVFKLKPNTTYTYSQNEAAGFSIQPDGGIKKYATNTNQMIVTTRPFRNINYRICCS